MTELVHALDEVSRLASLNGYEFAAVNGCGFAAVNGNISCGFRCRSRLSSSHPAQEKRQRDPRPAKKQEVNSNEQADRIEPRDRPLRQQ